MILGHDYPPSGREAQCETTGNLIRFIRSLIRNNV